MSDVQNHDDGDALDVQPEEQRDDAELEEPSTEQEPGEEPKAPEPDGKEPSHHAVGIGVHNAEIPGEEGADEVDASES
ncbi:hypothetical protein [Microbacterium gilvum]|uniref:Uncharacterized protein n=1 Tax=Microbacterium gilvum TaxID=1336204 RepID=A0ABP9A9I3_9MICO